MKLSKHWILLALCCGLSTCSIGLSINCSGIFYTPVAESLGILRGSFALHMTIFSVVTAVFAFVIPSLMKKIPYKLLLTSSVIIAVVTTALMGFVKTLPMFYILGALRGMSTALFSSVPLTMIINNWFVEKHGLATSIVFSFSGVAGTIFSPILTHCIESYGWQMTYVIMGTLILLFSLPSILVPFKLNPEDENLLPLGGKREVVEIKETKKESFNFFSVSFISFFLVGLFVAGSTGLAQHFPGYAQSIGYSASTGAMLVSAAMMGNIIFKLLVGILSDKIGTVKTIYILLLIIILGTVLMILGISDLLMIAGAFMFGATYGIGAVGLALLTKHFFGVEKYATVYPSIAFSTNMGSAIMLSVVGYIYDFFGSYIYAFMSILIIIVLSVLLMRVVEKTVKTS